MEPRERCSEPATVRDVYAGHAGHPDQDHLYIEVVLQFAGGQVKALCLSPPDRDAKVDAVHELCALFGVGELAQMKGRPCTALRCWPEPGQPLEGIEVDGRRFTVTRFLREHGTPLRASPVEARVAQAEQERLVMSLEFGRAYGELSNRIAAMRASYVDWG